MINLKIVKRNREISTMGSKYYCLTGDQCCGNHRYAEIEITDDSIIIKDRLNQKVLYRKVVLSKLLNTIIAENCLPRGITSRVFLNESETNQALQILILELQINN